MSPRRSSYAGSFDGRRDEHRQFERPSGRSRPRTKQRPTYDDAVSGFVITIDRGRYTCLVGDALPGSADSAVNTAGRAEDGASSSGHADSSGRAGTAGDAGTSGGSDWPAAGEQRTVVAMRARSLGRTPVVVGDRVRLVGDVSGAPDTLARIVEVTERDTVLRRTADDDDAVERVVVANVDQLVIVTALTDPPPRPRLIDRCLVAAYDAGIDPLLCLTKSDLASPEEVRSIYAPLRVPTVITRSDDDPEPLRDRLAGRLSVLVGHSGVGKSTLVNALVPGANRVTGEVNEVTGRGRHTSTQAMALQLPFGGWIIDTPGIRSFGLAHVAPDDVIWAFADLDEVAEECPRGCSHARSEPECALDLALGQGRLDGARVESYRRLLESRDREG